MGNTEVKQLVQETPLNHEEVTRLQKLYKTYGTSLAIERPIFASLFDASQISFQVIDRLFDAFDKDANGCIDMSELALGLIACDRSPIEEKLKFLFTVLDQNGDRRLTRRELKRMLLQALLRNIARVRGQGGAWPDRECAGCKRVPSGVVYSCMECCDGYIMGVPVATHLCEDCSQTWEGVLEENFNNRHRNTHQLCKHGNPPIDGLHHPGVQCDACGMLPIIGPRYHCMDCKDMLELCSGCHGANVEPLCHSASHQFQAITTMQTEEEQVLFFLEELFDDADANQDGVVSPQEFVEWGAQSEMMNNILNGFEMHYVRLSPYEESVELVQETYHQDPDIGRIDVEEIQG